MVKEVNNGVIFPVALEKLNKSLFICFGGEALIYIYAVLRLGLGLIYVNFHGEF